MLSEKWDESAELRLNTVHGPASGPPFLLLHGVTRRWQDFLTLIPPLALRWQIHGLDFRGHGCSECADRYLVVDYVRDAVAIVRTYFTEPGVVYGHSLGALVAAAVAAAEPERVRAVVLEDPPSESFIRGIQETASYPLFAGMRELAGQNLTVVEGARHLGQILIRPSRNQPAQPLSSFRDATALRFGARCLRDVDPNVLTPLLEGRWLEGYDVADVLRNIRCPALLLAADEEAGGLLARADAEHMAQVMPDCTLIALPKVGHLIHWMQPDTTLRLLTGFLESL